MKLIIRKIDPQTKQRVSQEPAATIEIRAKTALVEIEGREYEIELGPGMAKALHTDDDQSPASSDPVAA